MIFVEDPLGGGAPPSAHLNSVGPTLMALGTDEQKRRILPGILQGEVHFAIGYTEPSAGTDLASLTTRAVRDGDEYVINGQKVFTSAIQYADYVWLAARTDRKRPNTRACRSSSCRSTPPGFTGRRWPPLSATSPVRRSTRTCGCRSRISWGRRTRAGSSSPTSSTTSGWRSARPPDCSRSLTEVRRWAQDQHWATDAPMIDQEWVRLAWPGRRQGRCAQALQLESGVGCRQRPQPSRCVRHQGLRNRAGARGLSTAARHRRSSRLPDRGVAGRHRAGRLENQARSQTIFTFGGGTNEIRRDIVAMVGLGIPRAPR